MIQMPKLPTRSLIQLFGGLFIAVVVGMLVVFPAYRGLGEKDAMARKIRSDIRMQQVLAPLFREMLEKASIRESCELALVAIRPWPRKRTLDLMDRFTAMGREHHLDIRVQFPDAASLVKQPGRFPVEMMVRGRFESFRPFFITLYKAPFIEHVEKIRILTDGESEEMQIRLWVAQK